MAELEIKSAEGKVVGKRELSSSLSEAGASRALLHRVVVAEHANRRQGTQSAKTRAEVRGGGRKPYKQKKTGNARQGSIRAPHYTHGGMALAVKPRDYVKKVNRRERRAAILGALGARIAAGDVVIADKIQFTEARTKHAAALLSALEVGQMRRILVVLPIYDKITYKAFRNIPGVEVRTAPSKDGTGTGFSTRDVLVAHKIVLAQEALARIEEVWAK